MRSRQTSKIRSRFLIAGGIFTLAVLSWEFVPAPGQWLAELTIRPLLYGETVLHQLAARTSEAPDEDRSAELNSLRQENESLRALLGDEGETRIAAGIIGRPTALPYDVLMLDKGSDEGIMVDTAVYAGDDTVIGYVTASYQHTALVTLVSTPGFTSTAYVFGPNIYTTAIGIGGGITRIHVPQGIKLSVGDSVVLPSLSSGIYGNISAIDSVPELPEQYGYVASQIPIHSLRVVAVGTRPLSVMDFETARAVVETAKKDFLMIDVPDDMLIDVVDATSSATTSDTAATTTGASDETLPL